MRLGLALSGGGFRATLFHLGVVRYLHEVELLPHVRHIASVSGGSVLAAHLVRNWGAFCNPDKFADAMRPLVRFAQRDVRGRIVRRLLTHLPLALWEQRNFALRRPALRNVLFDRYLRELFGEETLLSATKDEPEAPTLELLSTNLTQGSLAYFSRGAFVPNHKQDECVETEVPLFLSVATSAAFPIFFPPRLVDHQSLLVGRNGFPTVQHLTDGGVYDNLGVRRFQALAHGDVRFDKVIVSDAVGAFDWQEDRQSGGLLKTAIRASDILMKRIGELEFEAAEKAGYRFLRIGSSHSSEAPNADSDRGPSSDADPLQSRLVTEQLRHLRTDLDRFSDLEIRALLTHGREVAASELRDLAEREPIGSDWLPRPKTRAETRGPLEVARQLQLSRERSARLYSWRDGWSYIHLLVLIASLAWLTNAGRLRWERQALTEAYRGAGKDTFEVLTECTDVLELLPRYETGLNRWPRHRAIVSQAAHVGMSWNEKVTRELCPELLGESSGETSSQADQAENRGRRLIRRVVENLTARAESLEPDEEYLRRRFGAYLALWAAEDAVDVSKWDVAEAEYRTAVEEYVRARTLRFTNLHLVERLVCNTAVEALEMGLHRLQRDETLTPTEANRVRKRSIDYGETAHEHCRRSIELSRIQDRRAYWPAVFLIGKSHFLRGLLQQDGSEAQNQSFEQAAKSFVRAYGLADESDKSYFEDLDRFVRDVDRLCRDGDYAETFDFRCEVPAGGTPVEASPDEAPSGGAWPG